ncbi:MAG: hypothetical protein WDO71_18535 [Bacteroidota bacterium]
MQFNRAGPGSIPDLNFSICKVRPLVGIVLTGENMICTFSPETVACSFLLKYWNCQMNCSSRSVMAIG